MTGRVLFHVQHLLGIGHLRRAALIARSLAERGCAVTLVSGGMPVPSLIPPGPTRFVQLEPVRAADAGFRDLVDAAGAPLDDALRERRRGALLGLLAETDPDVLVVEAFPFGRRAFRFELDPLIAAARARAVPPRILCSVRDIVVIRDEPARRRWTLDRLRDDFDAVLVHADPAFIALEDSFPEAAEIGEKLVYTGYVAEVPAGAAETRGRSEEGAPEIVVSAGGGAVGGALLGAALAARRAGALADRRWLVLSGPNLPEAAFRSLGQGLPDGVRVERFREDFPALLRGAVLSVSQAGYNTVLDMLQAGIAAVLVPFSTANETEQALRAAALARRGLAEIVTEEEMTPDRLAAAMQRALACRLDRPRSLAVDSSGAARAAALIAAEIGRRRTAPP